VTPLVQVSYNLVSAWAMASAIGWERSYNGRVAGLRTHGLVALASAAVMSTSYAPALGIPDLGPPLQLVPTQVAQGVMTGLGFLGAGVIFKEGASIQGLTTAAALWTSAALGVLCGIGLQAPALLTTVIAILTLSALRWIEARAPARVLGLAVFRFAPDGAPDEAALRRFLAAHDVRLMDVSYALTREPPVLEYRGEVESESRSAFEGLATQLRALPGLLEFDIHRISK
jgi:putative Mg2+ transporter-C (MgtC) family protein